MRPIRIPRRLPAGYFRPPSSMAFHHSDSLTLRNESNASPLPTLLDTPALQWKSVDSEDKKKASSTTSTAIRRLGSLGSVYAQLSKSRLATLVTLTTMSGYAMAPLTCSTPPSTLIYTTLGTALCIASANAFNQWMEVPYDAQMKRTRNRLLVQHRTSPLHAFSFGLLSGVSGVSMLYSYLNPLTAALGASNILLYAYAYTSLKRRHPVNTWVGAVVGAIPPVMGWTAVTGHLDAGALVMGSILFAWQFPHFNALSYLARHDYAQAGYPMLAVTSPKHNALVSLRYALALVPLSCMMTGLGVTTPCFMLTATVACNAPLCWRAWRFYKQPENEQRARQLFFASLFHLPVLVLLMLLHKRQWPRQDKHWQDVEDVVHRPFGVHQQSQDD